LFTATSQAHPDTHAIQFHFISKLVRHLHFAEGKKRTKLQKARTKFHDSVVFIYSGLSGSNTIFF